MFKKIVGVFFILLLFLSACGDQGNKNVVENDSENNLDTIKAMDESVGKVESPSNENAPKTISKDQIKQTEDSSNADTPEQEEKHDTDESQYISNEEEKNTLDENSTARAKTPPLKDDPDNIKPSKMEPSINYHIDESNVDLHFSVKNPNEFPFTFHFDTSQQFDYILKNAEGQVVEQYSHIQSFNKMPTERFVQPSGSLNFDVSIENLQTGKYSIVFVLIAKEMQPKTMSEFVIN